MRQNACYFYAMFMSLCGIFAKTYDVFPKPCFRLKFCNVVFKHVHMYFLFIEHSYMLGSS